MQPLNPEDLFIRQQAKTDEEIKEAAPAISLERFQELERTIRDNPLTVEPYLELAEIYRKAKRWNDTRRVLEKAASNFPEDSQARYLYEEAQLSRSLELCGIAEADHQVEPTQLTLEKLQRCQLERNVLRERVYRDRLNRHPDQLELMLPLAESLEKLDRRQEAIELLKRAIERPELRTAASLQLGKLLETSQKVTEALSAYRQAALFRLPAPDPDIKREALERAADLAERSHLNDSARRYATMLAKMQPQNQAMQERLARLKEKAL